MDCPNCGKRMIWKSDFTFKDVYAEGDGIITLYECFNCGTSARIEVPEINPYVKVNGKGRKDGKQSISPSDVV